MKTGIVLSGGGVRGLAHLGVLKAIDEFKIEVVKISGASAGAIAGAFYAAGYPPDEILEIIISTKFLKLIKPALGKSGLLKTDATEAAIRKYFPDDSFESLKIPLSIVTTDLRRGNSVFFDKGELIKPMVASSCIPVLMKPVAINGSFHVDGGILNILPVEPLIGECDKIIGVYTNPIDDNFEIRSMKTLFERVFMLAVNYNGIHRKKYCDILIEPEELKKYRILQFARAREIFDIGYVYGKKVLESMLA